MRRAQTASPVLEEYEAITTTKPPHVPLLPPPLANKEHSMKQRSSTSAAAAAEVFTVGGPRLNFALVQHCGRQKELQVLLDAVQVHNDICVDTMSRKTTGAIELPPNPTIWIEAESGRGKSTLIGHFRDEINSIRSTTPEQDPTSPQSVVLFGKFEERAAASEPFAALSEAVVGLVNYIQNSQQPPQQQEQWAEGLRGALGTELQLLLGILPVLKPIFEKQHQQQTPRRSSAKRQSGSALTYSITEDNEDRSETLENYAVMEKNDDITAGDCDIFGDFASKEWRFARFRLAFRQLIRFACRQLLLASNNDHGGARGYTKQQQQPKLIFILDDIHWIDLDSLQIVKTLMEDPKKPRNLLLIAATRPVCGYESLRELRAAVSSSSTSLPGQPAPPVKTTMAAVPACKSSIQLEDDVTKLLVMEIGRLSVGDIQEMLQQLFGRARNDQNIRMAELATIVETKTKGNSFAVIQFLRLLERDGLLTYSNNEWQFDAAKIALVESISENISEVVSNSLGAVHGRRKSALMVAASFGVSQFDVSTIVHAVSVLEKEENKNADGEPSLNYEEPDDPYVVHRRVSDMSSELTLAANEGYVEETSPGNFRFSHDHIRESAYSLLPKGDSRKEVHLNVGRQLRSWMDTQSELGISQNGLSKESLLLHTTKQLNAGAYLIDDDWELLDLADLNYQAAELAAQKTAFHASVEYLQLGLSHLREDPWQRNYDRALKFSVALTRMQYSVNHLAECWATSEAVITHGKHFRDKSRIYHTRILCLMQQQRMKEAQSLCLEVFDLMGRPMPRRRAVVFFHAITDYITVRRFLKATPDEELRKPPLSVDDDLEVYLDFLLKFGEIAYLGGTDSLGYLLLFSFRNIRLLEDNGNHPRSFIPLMCWACMQTQFSNFAGATTYSDIALSNCERQQLNYVAEVARFKVVNLTLTDHWRAPVRQSLPVLVEANETLWGCGEIDNLMMDAIALVNHFYAAGEPIETVVGECVKYSEAAVDYDQMMHWYIIAPLHQAMLNLEGDHGTVNPAVLTGSHMDIHAYQAQVKSTQNKPAVFQFQFWSMFLAYHFGDFKMAKHFIKAMRSNIFEDGPTVLVPLRLFYTGLSYLALFKETRKSKYQRRAKAASRQLKGWADKGAVTCVYMSHLVKAETLACSRRVASKYDNNALKAYDQAIQAAFELGVVHHCALANELAGAYLFGQETTPTKSSGKAPASQASTYLLKAVELYQTWGATAKVADLRSRYGCIDESASNDALD